MGFRGSRVQIPPSRLHKLRPRTHLRGRCSSAPCVGGRLGAVSGGALPRPLHVPATSAARPSPSGRSATDRNLSPARFKWGARARQLKSSERPPWRRSVRASRRSICPATDDAVVRHGILEQGVPYLQKPFTPDAIASKVREILDRPPTGSAAQRRSQSEVPAGSRRNNSDDINRRYGSASGPCPLARPREACQSVRTAVARSRMRLRGPA